MIEQPSTLFSQVNLQSSRNVSAGDLSGGVLSLDLVVAGSAAPVLNLDNGITLAGINIKQEGTSILGSSWAVDGMQVFVRCQSGTATLKYEDGGVPVGQKITTSSGGDLTVDARGYTLMYFFSLGKWGVAAARVSGDYTTSQITNSSGVAGSTSTDALNSLNTLKANLASPTFTGTPAAPTASPGTNTTQLSTTAFVTAGLALKADLASPALTGTPTAPTASPGTSTTQLATTAFVTTADNLKANLASPALTGTPTAPTASPGTNTTQLATTAFVAAGLALKADLASPALTGTPTAPTAATGTNTTQIATTAYVAQYVPTVIVTNGLVVAAAPTFTTVCTQTCAVSTAYCAEVQVDVADDPLTAIRAGRWIIHTAFHRNSAGGAVVDAVSNPVAIGGFSSMAATAIASGNDVLIQVRFATGATVNARVECRVITLTPG